MPRSEFHRRVLGLLTVLLGFLAFLLVIRILFPLGLVPGLMLSSLGPVPGLALWILLRHRAMRRLAAADFLLCPKCDYPLNRLAASGQCPECGEPFTAAQVRRAWRRYYRFPPFGDAP